MSLGAEHFDVDRVIAVVIGREGSRGLPGKNLLPIGGRPMIAHSIGHAQSADSVGRVLCSTDGTEIAEAAAKAGAEVVLRPPSLASDTATVDAAVRHAVEGIDVDVVVVLYGNVPIRPEGLVDRAVRELVGSGADSVQSYSPVGKHHPYWTVRLDEEGMVAPWEPNDVYRRQELPPAFIPDGGVIAVTRTSLFQTDSDHPHAFLGRNRRGVRNPPGSVVDVDDRIDYLVAEAMQSERRA